MGNDGNDETRRLILARRARFVAAALASVAATTTALGASVEACGGETTQQPGTAGDGGNGTDGANPQPCLSPTANPQPCLSRRAPLDAGNKDADADADAGEPQPCLSPPAPDGG